MTQPPTASGLEAVFLANREKLLRFLETRGAGEAAEDLLHELWLKVAAASTGPISAPLPYLFRAANMVLIDRYRSRRQADLRDRDWLEATGPTEAEVSDEPSSERRMIARETAAEVETVLNGLGSRVVAIFRRHRVDGVSQRQVAAEMGLSVSTVESDLRQAYRVLAKLRRRLDEA